MAASGFQTSMARSLKSNSKLLNRNNLFAQLKSINQRSEQKYKDIPLPKQVLTALRKEEERKLKSNLFKRRVIGLLVVIPTAIIIMVGFYVLVNALI